MTEISKVEQQRAAKRSAEQIQHVRNRLSAMKWKYPAAMAEKAAPKEPADVAAARKKVQAFDARRKEAQEIERLRDVLSAIAAPLHIDGENHAASVIAARAALAAKGGVKCPT